MMELSSSMETEPLTLEQLTVRVKALEKVVLTMLEILSVGDK